MPAVLFKTVPTNAAVYEGKMIWQFDAEYSQPQYWVDVAQMIEYLGEDWKKSRSYRMGFRSAGENTNERNFISTIVPAGNFCGNSIILCDGIYQDYLVPLYLCSVFNSCVLDFTIRLKIARNMNMFFIDQLPVPKLTDSSRSVFFDSIVSRAARLVCTAVSLASCGMLYSDGLAICGLLVSQQCARNYGPTEEREIRLRLAGEPKT